MKRIILGQIDEKIAVLNGHITEVPNWKNKDKEYVNIITNKIVADITSISRIRNDVSDDQRIRINEQLIRLINAMKKDNHDTAAIEAVSQLINA